jgi:hypothetical protein
MRAKIVAGFAAAWLVAALLAAGPLQSEESLDVAVFLVVIGPALAIALGLLLVGAALKMLRSSLGKDSPSDDDW